MTNDQGDLLRMMVREVLRDVLPGMVEDAAMARLTPAGPAPTGSTPTASTSTDREVVVIRHDADLDQFVRRIVSLAESPVTRQHLKSGRLRFTLAASAPAGTPSSSHGPSAQNSTGRRRIERGALTERAVRDAAAAGESLVLARGVVITPLARDRARALGVDITVDNTRES